jgi:hypothetical protein
MYVLSKINIRTIPWVAGSRHAFHKSIKEGGGSTPATFLCHFLVFVILLLKQ